MKRLAILISGRGSNMAVLIQACQQGVLRGLAEVVLVVSNKRRAPGLVRAAEFGVQTSVLSSRGKTREDFDRELIDLLHPHCVDWVVLAGFMRLLSPVFVDRFRGRIVNIHPADTAAYQGLHGYRWAFENKLRQTHATVHLVDEGLDTGRVLGQARIDLNSVSCVEDVEARGLAVEHQLYPEVLARLCRGELDPGAQ